MFARVQYQGKQIFPDPHIRTVSRVPGIRKNKPQLKIKNLSKTYYSLLKDLNET